MKVIFLNFNEEQVFFERYAAKLICYFRTSIWLQFLVFEIYICLIKQQVFLPCIITVTLSLNICSMRHFLQVCIAHRFTNLKNEYSLFNIFINYIKRPVSIDFLVRLRRYAVIENSGGGLFKSELTPRENICFINLSFIN